MQCSLTTTKVTTMATNMTTNYGHVTTKPSSLTTENNLNIPKKTSANTAPYTPLTTTQTGNTTTEAPIVYTQCYMVSSKQARPQGYIFFHLSSTEHEISTVSANKEVSYFCLSSVVFILLINVKMPTIVGILTFMSRINFVLS